MLLKFSISNYLSFRDKAILDFEGGAIKEKEENIDFSVTRKTRTLKSISIYGPNSSGKSNMLKGFAFARNLILNSARESRANEKIEVENFRLNFENADLPSTFEFIFVVRNEVFRYGFEVTDKIVKSEWLFKNFRNKSELIFIRNNQLFEFNKKLVWKTVEARAKFTLYTTMTRDNTLFLSALSNFNDEFGKKINNWFSDSSIIFDGTNIEIINYTASLLQSPNYRHEINKLISQVDLGFSNIRATAQDSSLKPETFKQFISSASFEAKKNYTVITSHRKFNKDKHADNIDFNLFFHESVGTQKFFGLLGPILKALQIGSMLWIDELDSRLHPHLFSAIVKLFNSNMNNPKNAQLVFTANNTLPLKNLLRRDQMVFMEKDSFGNTSMKSLYEKYPKIRNDASFEKDYLDGKYGSVPKMGSQLDLFNEE